MWFYVYILELTNGKHYVGCTTNLKERIRRHTDGQVRFTSPFRPIKFVWGCAFADKFKAFEFERYLKSGSGRAFSFRHLL